jgi:hypothetical protein
MPYDKQTRTWTVWLAAGTVAVVVVLAYSLVNFWVLVAAVAVMAAAAWVCDTRDDVKAYVLLLGVQIPQAEVVFRAALADFFLVPVILREAWSCYRERRLFVATTLLGPFAALIAVMILGTVVGAARMGRLTSYVLFNKDAGILFLMAGTLALSSKLRTRESVRQAVQLFVDGVSVLNVIALCGVGLSFAGIQNPLYFSTTNRLNGLMLNPSSYGALVTIVAMLELSSLSSPFAGASRRGRVRWINFILLLVAAGCTLSRSTWISISGGAMGVLFAWIPTPAVRPRIPASQWAAGAVAMVVPLAVLVWIATAHPVLRTLSGQTADARAAELQQQLVGICAARYDPDLCWRVPQSLIDAERQHPSVHTELPQPKQPTAPADSPTINPNGALMNARGLDDRVAIIRAALRDYTQSPATEALGIGIGTFLATSAFTFGVPLIVHNTIVWFLVEMGPLGLAAFVWLFGRTCWNVWCTRALPGWEGQVSQGVAGGLSAWLAFSLFNEALYLRQFWLLILVADRLFVLSHEARPDEAAR